AVGRAAVASIEARQAVLVAEAASFPGAQELRDAYGTLTGTRTALERALRRAAGQAVRVEDARRASAEASAELDTTAADLGLPVLLDQLRAAQAAVHGYTSLAQKLVTALWQHQARLDEVATCTAELAGAEQELAGARAHAAESADEARDAAARLAAVREAIGDTADGLRRRLEQVKQRIGELKAERRSLDAAHAEQSQRRARLEGREEQLQANLGVETTRRDAAVAAFWPVASTGLLDVAVEGAEAGTA